MFDNYTKFKSAHQKIAEEKKPIDKEDTQPVKVVQTILPPITSNGGDIFPRKKKGGLVSIKPAVWEKNREKLKITILRRGGKPNLADGLNIR